jgi:signal transduction histidine kinase
VSPRSLLITFAVALVVLTVNAFVLLNAVQRWRSSEETISDSYRVTSEIQAVVGATADAEAGELGFLMTGRRQFLEPYNAAKTSVYRHLDTLQVLVVGDTQQVRNVDRLRAEVARRLAWSDSLILQQQRDPAEAAMSIASEQGRTLMNRVRTQEEAMLALEDERRDARVAASRRRARAIYATFAVSTLLALGLVFGLYRIVRRDQETREIAARALKMNNERLEARVAERTAEIASANEALTRSNQELQRSNRELQEFAFVASHDLQEPLRKIRTFADLLREEHGAGLDDEAQHYLGRMQQAATRMSRLISDLLTFSRVSTKARPFEPVALDDVLREALDDLDMVIQDTGADVQAVPLPRIEADPIQMRQLFQNLVGNALKFHRPDVSPEVRIRPVPADDDANVAIEVADNGIGFDPKYAERIFVPFQRLHTRGEYDGTGIGLAVVRRIVERHGGAVTVESEEGQGTTFVVTLPRHHDAPLVPGPEESEPAEAQGIPERRL